MIVSQIAAMAKNRVIGVDNKLPWHIPEDLKFFREKTKNSIIIMGRKTFESLPGVLPKRFNIVVTRQENYTIGNPLVLVVDSIENALREAEARIGEWGQEVFIAGGGEIYTQALPYSDRIYLTVIDREVPGDARFPEFDVKRFKLVERRERQEPEPFAFCVYENQQVLKV
ncbi:MAG: dihydrofolate reductase [Pseudobdellovibrionaceae bacterium]